MERRGPLGPGFAWPDDGVASSRATPFILSGEALGNPVFGCVLRLDGDTVMVPTIVWVSR